MHVHPFEHGIGQRGITDELIAVVAVFVVLMQVNVINAGAAVEQGIIDNETFQMQYAHCFASINRNAIDWNHVIGMLLGHLAIPVGVSNTACGTNATPLRAVPVD